MSERKVNSSILSEVCDVLRMQYSRIEQMGGKATDKAARAIRIALDETSKAQMVAKEAEIELLETKKVSASQK